MLAIPEVSDGDMIFGQNIPLPAWDSIPEEFKGCNATPFNEVVSTLFFEGGRVSDFLTPKEGVDVSKALRAIKCCLGSFEPKHEHKEAGVAFMLSEWFDLV
jgi:hypothetical protein